MNKYHIVSPGSNLGMLGGGQLGGFFTEAALRMGYKVSVWDPSKNAPAKRFASRSYDSPFDNFIIAEDFANSVDAISLEWENVPKDLVEYLEKRVSVRPGSKSLNLAQNRIFEKDFLKSNNIPITNYKAIYKMSDFDDITFPKPWIIKTATMGYDGHGQWRITGDNDLELLKPYLSEGPWVAESIVDYNVEISVIVAFDGHNVTSVYPVIENHHENSVLRYSIYPARVSEKTQDNAKNIAKYIVHSLGDPGLFCVEMFVVRNDDIVVNEIAPRPHNSGHLTIDGFSQSQYEMQIRVLCGLPLPTPISYDGPIVMLNILGYESEKLITDHIYTKFLNDGSGKLYLYGKEEVRKGRKMGHIVYKGLPQDILINSAIGTLGLLADDRG